MWITNQMINNHVTGLIIRAKTGTNIHKNLSCLINFTSSVVKHSLVVIVSIHLVI